MLDFNLHIHKPLREIVYEELKRQILVGEIQPGTRMMEIQLADDMGVSRTPVREAIRKLEKEGLVNIEPRRGAYASDASIKDMIDILEARQYLEGAAAMMASSRITGEQIKELEEATEKYATAVEKGDTDEIIKYDEIFHKMIIKASGNTAMVKIMSRVQELSLRFRYLYYEDFSRYKNMPMSHREILAAIINGDGAVAGRMAADHVARLKDALIENGDSIISSDHKGHGRKE